MTHQYPEKTILQCIARIRLMIFDVDGVLTDGKLYIQAAEPNNPTEAMKAFHSLDGYGIQLLHRAGLQTAIITSRCASSVETRARELGIPYLYQGVADKWRAFIELCAKTGLTFEAIGYMGDDWPDLPVMLRVGFAVAPANAHHEVCTRAHWTTQNSGGSGAVREVCDLILYAQGKYIQLLEPYLAVR